MRAEPKDLTELSESEIVALTLKRGIRVERCKFVFPGFTGQIDAPFNEGTKGNPVYEIWSRTKEHHEDLITLEGLRVTCVCNPIRMAGAIFLTPDGVVSLTECGAFYAHAPEPCIGIPEEIPDHLLAGFADEVMKSVVLPRLLNTLYAAVFAADTVPAHWKAKGGEQP